MDVWPGGKGIRAGGGDVREGLSGIVLKALDVKETRILRFNMKPMMIVGPDVLAAEEIRKLEENGICAVVAKDPAACCFVEALPVATTSSRTELERAALKTIRQLFQRNPDETVYLRTIRGWFTSFAIEGSSLDPDGTKEEREQKIIDGAREEELCAIGRLEARELAKARREAKKRPEEKVETK